MTFLLQSVDPTRIRPEELSSDPVPTVIDNITKSFEFTRKLELSHL